MTTKSILVCHVHENTEFPSWILNGMDAQHTETHMHHAEQQTLLSSQANPIQHIELTLEQCAPEQRRQVHKSISVEYNHLFSIIARPHNAAETMVQNHNFSHLVSLRHRPSVL